MYNNNFDPEERIDWELQKEQQEQKKLGWNAFKKPRKGGCRLPHERLSKKELQDLNGEVKVMNMNAPIAYKAFKMWPIDIQQTYLNGLALNYGVSAKKVAEMMGVTPQNLHRHIKVTGMRSPFGGNGRHSSFDQAKWDAFCGNASESDEKARSETNSVPEGSEPVSENAPESDEKTCSEANRKLSPDDLIEHVKSGLIPYEEAAKAVGYRDYIPMGEYAIDHPKDPDEENVSETKLENGDILQYWGNPPIHKTERRSGRYPWGQDQPEKTPEEWIEKIKEMQESGLSDAEIRDRLDMSFLEYHTLMTLAYKEAKERRKQTNLQFLTFSFRAKDLKSWDELFEFVKAVKLPFNNTVEINVQEYYRPFGPGDLPGRKGGNV